MKRVQIAVAILVGLIAVFGASYKLDCRWAKPSMDDHQILAGDLRHYQITNIQKELWMFEDRYKGVPEYQWNPEDLQRYRMLRMYLQCLQEGRKNCGFY